VGQEQIKTKAKADEQLNAQTGAFRLTDLTPCTLSATNMKDGIPNIVSAAGLDPHLRTSGFSSHRITSYRISSHPLESGRE
jgi:hypothetical protein